MQRANKENWCRIAMICKKNPTEGKGIDDDGMLILQTGETS